MSLSHRVTKEQPHKHNRIHAWNIKDISPQGIKRAKIEGKSPGEDDRGFLFYT
jgi:hypothetical protein